MTTAAKRRRIDAATGDYVTDNGRPVEGEGILPSVLVALLTTRGSSAAAPELGTRTNAIRKLTANAPRLAERYDAEALRHLVERGDIRALTVRAEVIGATLSRVISYEDRSGKRQTFRVTRRVGT